MSDGVRKKWRSLKKNRHITNSTYERRTNNNVNGENNQEILTDTGPNDKNQTSKDSKSNSNETGENSSKNGERYECVKCNLVN